MTNKDIVVEWFLENEYELFFKMQECEHGYLGVNDNSYHLEGNIWNHTKMVLDEVQKLENPTIEMYLIALLHDIGKPLVYFDNHETKRRRFINHEAYSVFEAKRILDKLSKDIVFDREIVLKTIANHGRFYNYMKEDGLTSKGSEVIFQMYKKDLRAFDYMTKFFHCDHNGRITSEGRSGEEVKKDFNDIRSRIREYKENHISDASVKNTLRLLVRPPRSGKSTFIKNIIDTNKEYVISRDDLVESYGVGSTYSEKWNSLTDEDQKKIDVEIQKRFKQAIDVGLNIVIDMTNMSSKSRRKWLTSNKKLKNYYKVANIFIEDLDTLDSRNSFEKTIDRKVLKNMIIRFSYPMYDEFDEVILETL